MPENILLIAYCKIGDTLVMLPALHALREKFPDARIGLISEYYFAKDAIGAEALLGHTGLINDFFKIRTSRSRFIAPWLLRISRAVLCRLLRKIRWDYGIVLMPPYPPMTSQFAQNLKGILASCGVDKILDYNALSLEEIKKSDNVLKSADWLLQSLSPLCDNLPPEDCGNGTLAPIAEFSTQAAAFSAQNNLNSDTPVITLAPSAHIQSNLWKIENYIATLKLIKEKRDIKTLVIGGPADREKITRICAECDFCLPVIGEDIRLVAELISRTSLYLGNDTGLMHMAAAKGVKCVGVFSCRNPRKIWEPYGHGHQIMRGEIECAGCACIKCKLGFPSRVGSPSRDGYPPCLEQIQPAEVAQACLSAL